MAVPVFLLNATRGQKGRHPGESSWLFGCHGDVGVQHPIIVVRHKRKLEQKIRPHLSALNQTGHGEQCMLGVGVGWVSGDIQVHKVQAGQETKHVLVLTLFFKVLTLFFKVLTLFFKVLTLFFKVLTLFFKVLTLFFKVLTLFFNVLTLFFKVLTLFFKVLTLFFNVLTLFFNVLTLFFKVLTLFFLLPGDITSSHVLPDHPNPQFT
ncbi:hypothetical protein NHX12_003881 [Muraenolepis orangiensis]|uniref:Uncharacterized protein n=1 Tax=Muraenolepis orangiensis TaxID=630683 RepID=A0A9Q0DRW1_9TELE|nr:hypothetical protein NHX12_003881 [Muraenolepis orangiensis]